MNAIFLVALAAMALSDLFFSTDGLMGYDCPTDSDGRNSRYYAKLTDAFLHGQTFLLEEPTRQLLTLPDPYDPLANRSYKFNDASLFGGHYYFYFGPTPVLTFYMPFYLVSGHYPDDSLAAALFMFGSFALILAVFLLVVRDYFPETPTRWVALLAAVLGYGNMSAYFLSRAKIYEVAIASGQLWLSAALLCGYLIVRDRARGGTPRLRALAALMGTALALGVGSRPQFALFCLAGTIVFLRQRRALGWGAFVAFFVPCAIGGLALAAYNYVRFENVLEFGFSYQLTWFAHPLHASPYTLRNVLRNLVRGVYFYLLRQPRFNGAFPYLNAELVDAPVTVADWNEYGREAIVGVFASAPFLIYTVPALLASVSGAAFWRSCRRTALPFLRLLAAVSGGMILFIVCYHGAVERYVVEFAGPFTLANIVAWLAVDDALSGAAWVAVSLRRLWRRLTGIFAWATIAIQLLFGFSGQYHTFAASNPLLMNALMDFFPKFNL